jgi:hypothetical protein
MNGIFLMRIDWPMGSMSPKRFVTTVLPSNATLLAELTSCWENAGTLSHGNVPNLEKTRRNAENDSRPVAVFINNLATASHPRHGKRKVRALHRKFMCIRVGKSYSIARAHAQSRTGQAVREHDDGIAPDAGDLLLRCFSPEPIAAVAITVATPIRIPNIVSAERSLFTCNARSAIRIDEIMCFIATLLRERRNSQRLHHLRDCCRLDYCRQFAHPEK